MGWALRDGERGRPHAKRILKIALDDDGLGQLEGSAMIRANLEQRFDPPDIGMFHCSCFAVESKYICGG